MVSQASKVNEPAPVHQWTTADSKAYARDKVLAYADKQWACLDKLWTLESNWRPSAYNKLKVMGKNAGGIPQILDLDPKLPETLQIDRGVSYILYRYGSFCTALKHHYKKGWY
jgi:hypothetical protein